MQAHLAYALRVLPSVPTACRYGVRNYRRHTFGAAAADPSQRSDVLWVQDIENYCEADDSDMNCEEKSAEWGIMVLFVYQAIQLLILWAAYSFYVEGHPPAVMAAPQYDIPVATAQPVKAAFDVDADHGAQMARHGGVGKGGSKQRQKEAAKTGGGHEKGKHKKGKKGTKHGGGEGARPPTTRRVIPIYEA
eukprot:COSAG05_NODE_3441_length_2060_cov_5.671144_3_plen_191_part_00